MEAKLKRRGDEFVIRIPASEENLYGLSDGQTVDVVPLRPRETLQDMLAEMDRLGPSKKPALVDWGPDVGSEIIDDDWS